MKIYNYPNRNEWNILLARPYQNVNSLRKNVNRIIETVEQEGDAAIRQFNKKYDQVELTDFKVSAVEFTEAEQRVSEELKKAIQLAKKNISTFHQAQYQQSARMTTSPGVSCWQKNVPIESVGLYIPGGSAPLFSTVLMLAVPAAIAKCRNIILCTPANKNGKVHPAILFAAKICGITQIYKIGGAQAIAVMAYGTETVPAVYKIFGPGNQYVTEAKMQVSTAGVAIDMPAGPSEVLVIADQSANPDFIAADLLSQAEHGVDSQVLLLTDSQSIADKTSFSVNEQLQLLPRNEIATAALANSKIIVLENLDQAFEMSNAYAPEHLILNIENADRYLDKIKNAGSVFVGALTPESAGDYASGTNHTLPTNGYARSYSGVSLDSFMKKITFQHINRQGIMEIGPAVEIMAEAEQLLAHKNAVSVRLKTVREEQ